MRCISFLAVITVCDAVWKPMKSLHRHESPERLFNEGDTNKDDYLDAEELKEFYKHDEHMYHAHAISEHFGGDDKATVALDLDKDGKISATEFLTFAGPAYFKAVAWDDFDLANLDGEHYKGTDLGLDLEEYKKTHYGRERVISKSHDGFKEHFVEIDANKDGKIDKDEWLGSSAAMDPFTHQDYNGDGTVSLEEMMRNEREHYHGIDHDHPQATENSKKAFASYDSNGDGKITRAEDRPKRWQPGTDEYKEMHETEEYAKIDHDMDDEDDDDDEEDL